MGKTYKNIDLYGKLKLKNLEALEQRVHTIIANEYEADLSSSMHHLIDLSGAPASTAITFSGGTKESLGIYVTIKQHATLVRVATFTNSDIPTFNGPIGTQKIFEVLLVDGEYMTTGSGGSGGGTIISGNAKKLAKFNTAGNNVENSSITDDTAEVLIEKPVRIDSLVANTSGLKFKNLKAASGQQSLIAINDQGEVIKTENPEAIIKYAVTKSQADALISSNSLFPGALYEISGCHPTLYDDGTSSGTTLLLHALSVNKFAKTGHGIFWNPKYDKIDDGFGIFGSKRNIIEFQTTNLTVLSQSNMSESYSPEEMAFSPSGDLYSSNAALGQSIKKFVGANTAGITFGNVAQACRSIAIDSVGNIYSSRTGAADNSVYKTTPSGVTTTFATFTNFANKIMIDSNDNLFVVHGFQAINKITPSGTVTEFVGGLTMLDIAIDSNDNIFIAGIGQIQKITPAGVLTTFVSGSPTGIIRIDPNDNVYVRSSNTISKYDTSGSLEYETIELPASIKNFAIDADEAIYAITDVIDSMNVHRISPDGSSFRSLGLASDSAESCIVRNGLVYVSATSSGGNSGIRIFDPTIILPFENNEFITADNGATGQWSNPSTGIFVPITGDWSTATTVSGDNSGAFTNIISVILAEYAADDKTIWGGYSWTNLTDAVGTADDQFTLDSTNWSKNQYSALDYNQAFDIIEYDYASDWISRRYDDRSNVDVKSAFSTSTSSIKYTQFGNGKVAGSNNATFNIFVDNGRFDNINFCGRMQYNIALKPGALQVGCTYDLQVQQFNLKFENNAMQSDINFKEGSHQYGLNLEYGARIQNFDLEDGIVYTNFEQGSEIRNLTLNGSSIQYCKFGANSNLYEVTFPEGRQLRNIAFDQAVSLNDVDLTNATLLFESSIVGLLVYSRPDGTPKIRYYDNDDALVISDIDDPQD